MSAGRMEYTLSIVGKRIMIRSGNRKFPSEPKSIVANRIEDPSNPSERENYLDTNPPFHSFSKPTQQTHTDQLTNLHLAASRTERHNEESRRPHPILTEAQTSRQVR